jgi:C1A family cysteine protease
MRQNARLGWRRDLPDQRDHKYRLPPEIATAIPSSANLRGLCPPVYDQGNWGSCVANAVAGAIEVAHAREGLTPPWTPSRMFIYRHARVLEGDVTVDAGCEIRDGIKTVATKGAPKEDDWPYIDANFEIDPPAAIWGEAMHHPVTRYESIAMSLGLMRGRLASGLPFVFGISVYDSFMSAEVARTGVILIPAPDENLVGGHALLAVGYDDQSARFLFRNSWGSGWGQEGYGTIPYGYLTDPNLAADFWAIDFTK